MNTFAVIIMGTAAATLVIFLIWRNMKDKRDFERQENLDYRKIKDEEGDAGQEE